MTETPLAVDIISDVVCPWCYLGKRRFERGAAEAGIAIEVRWRPYQLDPTIPPEGLDRRDYIIGKFGSLERIEPAHANLRAGGAAEGIRFDFERISVSPNTLDAHRLIRWAAETGSQGAVVTALFRAYFEEGRDVGDRNVLAAIAVETGLDGEAVRSRLQSDEDLAAVQTEIAQAQRLGVSGVPTFILAGKYAVVGAQTPDQVAQALRQVAAEVNASG